MSFQRPTSRDEAITVAVEDFKRFDQFFFRVLRRGDFLVDSNLTKTWRYLGLSPCPVTVTTRIITFLVGNPYKHSFVTVTGRGGDNPGDIHVTLPET